MTLVNFGCGEVFHRDWINLDGNPCAPEVQRCDIRNRLPFEQESVDAVYHSHVLEHLDAGNAKKFLRECRRILRPGGIIRVALPDLEGIARTYLHEIEVTRAGGDSTCYDWSRMELTDQAARVTSGGELLPFLRTLTSSQLAAVRRRAGKEVDSILRMPEAGSRLRRFTISKACDRLRREVVRGFARLIGGRRMQAMFDEGSFRQSGEVHRVMYDRVSLARLLIECGFEKPAEAAAGQSRILRFGEYGLEIDGETPRKPDSLYMEAERL
jgi:SAM-dependent methyltransferase